MDVGIIAVGRMKSGPEADLADRYLDRARKGGRAHGLAGFSVTEIPEGRAGRPADRMESEAAAILQQVQPGSMVVCLDEDGDEIGSEAFAALLRRIADEGRHSISFVIGGADGMAPTLLGRADRRIAFGRMTWPHQIVRILLAEQLYRATTILSGHPYHRA